MGLILLVVTAVVSWKLIKKSIAISRAYLVVEEEVDFGSFLGVVAGLAGLVFAIGAMVEPVALLVGFGIGILAVLVMASAAKNTGWAHAAPIFGLVYGTLLSFFYVPFGYNLTAGLGLGLLGFVIIWAKA